MRRREFLVRSATAAGAVWLSSQSIFKAIADQTLPRKFAATDTVTLGSTTLVAHLTPGHTRGCTTWTLKVPDAGRTYDVVIIGSLGVNPGFQLVNNKDVPQIAEEYARAFKTSRALPCDIPLGSHPGMYNMAEKYAKLGKGGANPYLDPAGYKAELDLDEAMYHAVLEAQTKAAK